MGNSSNQHNTSLETVQPLFICLGVRKAATTWIHRQLEAHPQIACTMTKETGYWMQNYKRGPDWYVQQFPRGGEYKVHAEVTPNYFNKIALDRLAKDTFDASFMVILRNPFERTFSEYLHLVRNGENFSLPEMLARHPGLITRSQYASAIREYLNHFPIDKLHIVLYEDIINKPLDVTQNIYRFINVDANFLPKDISRKFNVGRGYSIVDHALKNMELFSKSLGLKRKHLIKLNLSAPLDALYRLLSLRNPAPVMTEADKVLLDSALRHEVIDLQDIIHRDLSDWCN